MDTLIASIIVLILPYYSINTRTLWTDWLKVAFKYTICVAICAFLGKIPVVLTIVLSCYTVSVLTTKLYVKHKHNIGERTFLETQEKAQVFLSPLFVFFPNRMLYGGAAAWFLLLTFQKMELFNTFYIKILQLSILRTFSQGFLYKLILSYAFGCI